MNTYLGSSEFFGPEHVDVELIAAAQVTYLEGYLFDRPAAQEAYWKASQAAHDAGRRVSLTLSDTFCVERHRDAWRDLVADQVDILFANEDEAMALYEVDTFDEALGRGPGRRRGRRHHLRGARARSWPAATRWSRWPPTRSSRWSTPPAPATSTPPGSSSASPRDRSMADCGRLGSVAASAVHRPHGPRPGHLARPARRHARGSDVRPTPGSSWARRPPPIARAHRRRAPRRGRGARIGVGRRRRRGSARPSPRCPMTDLPGFAAPGVAGHAHAVRSVRTPDGRRRPRAARPGPRLRGPRPRRRGARRPRRGAGRVPHAWSSPTRPAACAPACRSASPC